MIDPESTILVAAANLLRTRAAERLDRARAALETSTLSDEIVQREIAHAVSVAIVASKAADGIDEFLGETAVDELTSPPTDRS